MKRTDISSEFKWDLSHIVESDDRWQELADEFKNSLARFEAYDGRLENRELLKECLDETTESDKLFGRLYTYAKMHKDEDGKNDHYVGYADRAVSLGTAYAEATSFVVPQISRMDMSFLESLIADENFADYDVMIKELIRAKEHILSDKEEKILAATSDVMSSFKNTFEAFDNVDLYLPKIRIDSEWLQLSHGVYGLALQNSDRRTRRDAFEALYRAFAKNINTLASNYAGKVKSNVFFSKVRGYESAIHKELDSEGIPTAVYQNLLGAIGNALPSLHKYVEYRKSYIPDLNMYDMYVPLIDGADMKLEYNDAYELVKTALLPLGEEYQQLLETAKDGGWIDVYETDNKRSGAYSWGTHGVHPYVLLNYKKTTHDIFTIAHELGHAMHSHYSNANLPATKCEYSIFVAEVASTVNEVLLIKHLLSTTDDKHLKRYLTQYYLDMFRTTIFRQTMFSEFEKTAHEMVERGEPLTAKALNDIYYALNQKYYGEHVIHNSQIQYEWARIPHFYSPFYVYKYATGLTTAIVLADKILQGDTESYFNFLKSGRTKLPYDILVDAGVDLATNTPYEIAMGEFDKALEYLLNS